MLTELPLPDGDNAPLHDDMISILSHVVQRSFYSIFDHLHGGLMIGPIAQSYSECVSVYSNFNPESIAKEAREGVAISTEFLAFDLYHQPTPDIHA